MRRPRILYVTWHWPTVNASAAPLRAWHIARALQQVGEVSLLTVGASPVAADCQQQTLEAFRFERSIEVHPARRSVWKRLQRSIDPRFPHPNGVAADLPDQEWVRNLLPKYDLIWMFQFRTPNMFNFAKWDRSVLDIDDIPSTYLHSVWRSERGWQRLRAGLQELIMRRREKLLPEQFTVLGVSSEADKRYLNLTSPVHVIPNGFTRSARDPSPSPAVPPRLGFIGVFNYEPNIEGMQWFIKNCWPRIKAMVPECQLRLVGTGSDDFAKSMGMDVTGLGWLPEAAEEIASWSGMVIPVRLGAGTRIKLVHGFSSRCPVVSTRHGAYGYEVRNGRELLLADEPAAFADACVSLIREPDKARALAECAWQQFVKNWTWDAVAPRVHAAAEECLRRSAASPGPSDGGR